MQEFAENLKQGDWEHEYAETLEPLRYQFLFMLSNLAGMLKLSPFKASSQIISDLMQEFSEALLKDYYEYRETWIADVSQRDRDNG